MAKETVQAVRQAEMKAVQMEREALARKEAILSEAVQNAKILTASLTRQAMDNAEKELTAADRKGNEMIEAAKIKAANEVVVMKDLALRKEEAAINMVLSSVIRGK